MDSNNTSASKKNFHCSKHVDNLLTRMEELRKDDQFCDVVLIAGVNGRKIPAHRFILAAASAYFSTMFASSMREAIEREITIIDVPENTLENIVEFCYTGSLELEKANAEEVFCAAHLLQFDTVVEACVDFLGGQLLPSNCLRIFLLAEQRDSKKLFEKAIQYACEFYETICKSQDFLKLNAEQLLSLLVRDDIMSSEKIVFNSVVSWIEYDRDNRQKDFSKLLPLIRLTLLEPSFIETVIEPICITTESQILLTKAFKWHALNERRFVKRSEQIQTTIKSKHDDMVILTVGSNNDTLTMEIYYSNLNKWTKLCQCKLPFPEVCNNPLLGVLVWRKKIDFVVKIRPIFFVYNFDIITGNISKYDMFVTELLVEDFGMLVFENYIYILGGFDGADETAEVKRYDLLLKEWSDIHSMNCSRRDLSVAVLADRIYAIGGYNISGFLNTVECYDKFTWKNKKAMNNRRARAAVGVLKDSIYVFGGYNGNCNINAVERYDVEQNTWTTIYNMLDPRERMNCVFLENTFFLIGGFDNFGRMTKTGECFDPSNNVMKRMADMIEPHLRHYSVLIPNTFS